MKKSRAAAVLCFVAALALATAAVMRAYPVVEPALRWNAVSAKPETVRVRFRHDGEGMLLFYVHARLRYMAAGQEVITEAASDYDASKLSEARRTAEKFASSGVVKAYSNPSDPKQLRFLLSYRELLSAGVAGSLFAAGLFVGLGWRFLRNSGPPMKCAGCHMPIKRFYRFCPHCKTPLPTATPASISSQP